MYGLSRPLSLQLVHDFLQVAGLNFFRHDGGHFASDISDLRRLGIAGLLDLVLLALGETNAEQTKVVLVGGFDIHESLDHGLKHSSEIQ